MKGTTKGTTILLMMGRGIITTKIFQTEVETRPNNVHTLSCSGLIRPKLGINIRTVYRLTVANVPGHSGQEGSQTRLTRMGRVGMKRRSRRIDHT